MKSALQKPWHNVCRCQLLSLQHALHCAKSFVIYIINIKSVFFFPNMLDPNLTLWKLSWLVETSPVHKTKNPYNNELEGTAIIENLVYLLIYRGKVLMGRVKSWA